MSINVLRVWKIPECGYSHILFLLLKALATQDYSYCEIYFLANPGTWTFLRNIFHSKRCPELPSILIILHKCGHVWSPGVFPWIIRQMFFINVWKFCHLWEFLCTDINAEFICCCHQQCHHTHLLRSRHAWPPPLLNQARVMAVPQTRIHWSYLSKDKKSAISGHLLHTALSCAPYITLLDYRTHLLSPLSHKPTSLTQRPTPVTPLMHALLLFYPVAYLSVRVINGQKFGNFWSFPSQRPSRH